MIKPRAEQVDTEIAGGLLACVRELVRQQAAPIVATIGGGLCPTLFEPGKMMRTRLAERLASVAGPELDEDLFCAVCAATEMVHTASLFHDDVIDNAAMRRGRPTLWRETTAAGAVLIGDLLLTQAMRLVTQTGDMHWVEQLLSKIAEVCSAEAEQELILRESRPTPEVLLRTARGKTGPLFAYAASVAGGDDVDRRRALDEAGYLVGTAYQVADDLLDVAGDEDVVGKTLGTDAQRGKATLAHRDSGGSVHAAARCVEELTQEAVRGLRPWPLYQQQLASYLANDLFPALRRQFGGCGMVGI